MELKHPNDIALWAFFLKWVWVVGVLCIGRSLHLILLDVLRMQKLQLDVLILTNLGKKIESVNYEFHPWVPAAWLCVGLLFLCSK